MNYRTLSLVGLVVALIPACTFDDGQPWGRVDFSVRTQAMDTSGRMDGELFKTAANFGLEIESLEVAFIAISAVQTAGNVASFDPASPPPGYSLCHNGHCHADDGRLVDYEEIQAGLSGANATGSVVTQGIDGIADAMRDQAMTLDDECTEDCEVERGEIGLVNLGVASVSLTARVYDLSTQGRLPEEGLPFAHTWEMTETMTDVVSISTTESPPGIRVESSFQLSPKVFDDVQWQSPEASTNVVVNGLNESFIKTKVTRYEL